MKDAVKVFFAIVFFLAIILGFVFEMWLLIRGTSMQVEEMKLESALGKERYAELVHHRESISQLILETERQRQRLESTVAKRDEEEKERRETIMRLNSQISVLRKAQEVQAESAEALAQVFEDKLNAGKWANRGEGILLGVLSSLIAALIAAFPLSPTFRKRLKGMLPKCSPAGSPNQAVVGQTPPVEIDQSTLKK